jgi:hypothetical protein
MANNTLFISYGHLDMTPINWVERLKLYLAPFRRKGIVDIWDDSRIAPGTEWRREIAQALNQSTSAILVVGPAFLASDFIALHELPPLLTAARTCGVSIYPLIVAYCAYTQSELGPYQAFNDPDMPLEALPTAEQNRILNDLSLTVDRDLRAAALSAPADAGSSFNMKQVLTQIAREMDKTDTAFNAQIRRRDLLRGMLINRLHADERLEFENLFFQYYSQMNDIEKFQFEQIRAMTEGPLHDGNEAILRILEGHPQLFEEIPSLEVLRQHLVFWLNKYDRVFVKRPEMCLLYMGVEDGVPFPKYAHDDVDRWLQTHR